MQGFQCTNFHVIHNCPMELLCVETSCTKFHPNQSRNTKGKAIPLQAWTGPEVSRRLRLPDFKTISTWRW